MHGADTMHECEEMFRRAPSLSSRAHAGGAECTAGAQNAGRAIAQTPSSCDIHGPQDSVVFNDLTQANGIWGRVQVRVQCAAKLHMCSFAAHCRPIAHVRASYLAKEHSKRVQHVQCVQ